MGFYSATYIQRTYEVLRPRETYLPILYSMVTSLGCKSNTGKYQCIILNVQKELDRLPGVFLSGL